MSTKGHTEFVSYSLTGQPLASTALLPAHREKGSGDSLELFVNLYWNVDRVNFRFQCMATLKNTSVWLIKLNKKLQTLGDAIHTVL